MIDLSQPLACVGSHADRDGSRSIARSVFVGPFMFMGNICALGAALVESILTYD